ncbi:hypothetical protein [Endozoicomonas sp. Mp262]|uniref:hypothetical protein n=1 Tax=Endozoicomonas sp. Mp262 TaxID=2919499 RepID=UPI0021DFF067
MIQIQERSISKSIDKDAVYPVLYNIWKNKKGFKKVIPESLSKETVFSSIDIIKKEANPVDDFCSPWAIMLPHKFKQTSLIRGCSKWVQGRKGVTADLNGIYMVEVLECNENKNLVLVRTRPEAGKKDIGPQKKFWIEPDLLFPLVKGASDFSKCYFKPKNELYVLVPNQGITKKFLLAAADHVENKLPKTYRYFRSYKDLLADRSTYKARLKKYDFYMIYNVGDYTFSPYKVIWAEQSGKFAAAVVGQKDTPLKGEVPFIPDHKIYFVDCSDKAQAHYLCGLLAAPLVCEFIESHTISIQVSNIFKHLDLPEFDAENEEHMLLAEKVEEAHKEHDENERSRLLMTIGELAETIIGQ